MKSCFFKVEVLLRRKNYFTNFDLLYKLFENENEKRSWFVNISTRFRDIKVCKVCKLGIVRRLLLHANKMKFTNFKKENLSKRSKVPILSLCMAIRK